MSRSTHLPRLFPLLLHLLSIYSLVTVEGFSTASRPHSVVSVQQKSAFVKCRRGQLPLQPLHAAGTGNNEDETDEDEDGDEEELNADSLGDWRKFRASLIDGGLPSDKPKTVDSSSSSKKLSSKKSVAAKNEELLAKQNQALAEEYRTGVWAHKISQAEVGGLLCRMPLEAELYLGKRKSYWKEKLNIMLRLEKEPTVDDENDEVAVLKQVQYWFALAERMVTRELQDINESGKVKNGILNPNDLGDNERLLLDKYMEYRKTWQEICLVTSHDPESGCSEAIILNRPITKAVNKKLATLLLEGGNGSGKGTFSYDFVDMVVQAFGAEAGVYMGGPDGQEEPAKLIHGIPNLAGARELAPGTGIYQGGWHAAVEGILEGTYRPLDFRFFLGRQSYNPKKNPQRGSLITKVEEGAYQPLACARSLALKQCLGLPKPLWHEGKLLRHILDFIF